MRTLTQNKIIYFLSTLIFSIIGFGYAHSEDEMHGYPVGGCSKKYIGEKCLSEDNFAFSKFELGESSFKGLADIFGEANIFKKPGDRRMFICYFKKMHESHILVEFGGYPSNVGYSIVSELVIKRDGNENDISMCSQLNNPTKDVTPESGLRLNLSKQEFTEIIYTSPHDIKDNFDFGGGYIAKNRKDFVNQGLRVKFESNAIIKLQYQISMEPL